MVFLRTAKWISVFHKMWAISSLNKQLSQSQEATCSMAIGSHHYYIKYNSNKSPTRCNNFPKYNPDVYLQLNMFRAFSRPSPGAQWLQWQPLVLPSYRGDSCAVFVVGPASRPPGQPTMYVRLEVSNHPCSCKYLLFISVLSLIIVTAFGRNL